VQRRGSGGLVLPDRLAHRQSSEATEDAPTAARGWGGALRDRTLAQALGGGISLDWDASDIRSEVHSRPIGTDDMGL